MDERFKVLGLGLGFLSLGFRGLGVCDLGFRILGTQGLGCLGFTL